MFFPEQVLPGTFLYLYHWKRKREQATLEMLVLKKKAVTKFQRGNMPDRSLRILSGPEVGEEKLTQN